MILRILRILTILTILRILRILSRIFVFYYPYRTGDTRRCCLAH